MVYTFEFPPYASCKGIVYILDDTWQSYFEHLILPFPRLF